MFFLRCLVSEYLIMSFVQAWINHSLMFIMYAYSDFKQSRGVF